MSLDAHSAEIWKLSVCRSVSDQISCWAILHVKVRFDRVGRIQRRTITFGTGVSQPDGIY